MCVCVCVHIIVKSVFIWNNWEIRYKCDWILHIDAIHLNVRGETRCGSCVCFSSEIRWLFSFETWLILLLLLFQSQNDVKTVQYDRPRFIYFFLFFSKSSTEFFLLFWIEYRLNVSFFTHLWYLIKSNWSFYLCSKSVHHFRNQLLNDTLFFYNENRCKEMWKKLKVSIHKNVCPLSNKCL